MGRLFVFLASNGPEHNCNPEGICTGTQQRPLEGPGSAGPLRGRKRDVYEGGHRVPGIISWPAVVNGPARVSWDTVVTMDFLPTVMEVLNVSRPPAQSDWAFDGRSVLPILRDADHVPPERGMGWIYAIPAMKAKHGYGYRWGKWKYVVGSVSCTEDACQQPQLYDLETDLSERNNLAAKNPAVLAAIEANFTAWLDSIWVSRTNEARCEHGPPAPTPVPTPTPPTPAPPPTPPTPPPAPGPPSSTCTFEPNMALAEGTEIVSVKSLSKEDCCGYCQRNARCVGAQYHEHGQCTLRQGPLKMHAQNGAIVCVK